MNKPIDKTESKLSVNSIEQLISLIDLAQSSAVVQTCEYLLKCLRASKYDDTSYPVVTIKNLIDYVESEKFKPWS